MPLSQDMLNIDQPKEKPPQATKEEKVLMKRAWKNRKTLSTNWVGALQEHLGNNFVQSGSQISFITPEERKATSALLDKVRSYRHTHEFLESLTEGIY